MDLNGAIPAITTNHNTNTRADFSTISGVISNSNGLGGITVAATAPLTLTGANSYNGTTTVTTGELRVLSLGNSATNPGGTSSVGATSAAPSAAVLIVGGTLTYVGAGETSD